MELEDRVEVLERELTELKRDLQQTLLAIQHCIKQEPDGLTRWKNRAWVLALLNTLVAITLFANIRLYPAGSAIAANSRLVPWLRGLWIVSALFWLILQIYPLALLLESQSRRPQAAAWRSTTAFFLSNPGLTITLALAALIVAAIGAVFPPMWFVVMVVLFVAACVNTAMYLLQLVRRKTQ